MGHFVVDWVDAVRILPQTKVVRHGRRIYPREIHCGRSLASLLVGLKE
jgi:hypothetical protein